MSPVQFFAADHFRPTTLFILRSWRLFAQPAVAYRSTHFLFYDKLRSVSKDRIQLFSSRKPLKHLNGHDNFILIYRSSL